MSRQIRIFDTLPSMVEAAAGAMAQTAHAAIADRGRCTIALSGGSNVTNVFTKFAMADIDWSKVFFFWSDDRFIERENPHSNYRLAKEAIFDRVPAIKDANIIGVPVELSDPVSAAHEYGERIRSAFGLAADEWPVFDLVQNGVGLDGHTASLFPHNASAFVYDHFAVMSHAGQPPWIDRISLTWPVFARARQIIVIAAGASKADILRNVIEGEPNIVERPASVLGRDYGTLSWEGDVVWMIDKAAASKLTEAVMGVRQ